MENDILEEVDPLYCVPHERLRDIESGAFVEFFAHLTVVSILEIYVPEDQRRKGLGKKLIQRLTRLATMRRMSVISGKVGPIGSTPLEQIISFYENLGFEVDAMDHYHDTPIASKHLEAA